MTDNIESYLVLPSSPPRTPSHSFVSQNSNENVQIINNSAAELYDYFFKKVIEIYKAISFWSIAVRKVKNNAIEYWHRLKYKYSEKKSTLKEFFDERTKKVLGAIKKYSHTAKKIAFGRFRGYDRN